MKQNFDYLAPDYPSFSINRHFDEPQCVWEAHQETRMRSLSHGA
jgi:hypothetical protein